MKINKFLYLTHTTGIMIKFLKGQGYNNTRVDHPEGI